jgi:hypothetical protein
MHDPKAVSYYKVIYSHACSLSKLIDSGSSSSGYTKYSIIGIVRCWLVKIFFCLVSCLPELRRHPALGKNLLQAEMRVEWLAVLEPRPA